MFLASSSQRRSAGDSSQWHDHWKAFLKDLLEQEFSQRSKSLNADAVKIIKNMIRDKMNAKDTFKSPFATSSSGDGKTDIEFSLSSANTISHPRTAHNRNNYHPTADPSSSSSGDRKHHSLGETLVSSRNAPGAGAGDPDLEPHALAERTLGLSSVQLAMMVKKLVAAKGLRDPEQEVKKLFSEVTALHAEYAKQMAGI